MMENDGPNGRLDGREVRIKANSPYEAAVLGFRNYWYPVCVADEVTEKPRAVKLLGDAVVLLRRQGKAYALADQCAHRGSQLSLGWHELPGTPTITCRYHGWTYDVTTGNCVAVLCEGPESAAVGKVRVRTYPVEKRKGIVWIWMGKMAPVPLEEDTPKLLLREDTVVKVRHGVRYGNWRFHAENVGGGHALVLHRYTPGTYFQQLPAYPVEPHARYVDDVDGRWILQASRGMKMEGEFPGLGRWPRTKPWAVTRLSSTGTHPVQGISQFGASLRLPGFTRVVNFPFAGCIYYEWYTPVDEDHYIYFQVSCGWPTNALSRARWELKYYLYGRPFMVVLFNNQDIRMVGQTTNHVKRYGMEYLTPLTKQDSFHVEWRKHANQWARGEGEEWLKQAEATRVSSQRVEALEATVLASGSEAVTARR